MGTLRAPQLYEEEKVPAVFGPLAELTLRFVDVREGARVIDLACGTGIVGRLVAEKVGTSGKVVGIDLSAGMIEVAKKYSPAREATPKQQALSANVQRNSQAVAPQELPWRPREESNL